VDANPDFYPQISTAIVGEANILGASNLPFSYTSEFSGKYKTLYASRLSSKLR
jgi:hypothetical protein